MGIFTNKFPRLVQQVLVSEEFMPEDFGRTDILTQTAIRAAVINGRTRIQEDDLFRADLFAPSAIAFFKPNVLTKLGGYKNILGVVQKSIQ